MKILLTGAAGQLGAAVRSCVPANVTCVALDRNQLDITDWHSVQHQLRREDISVVINAAAYTDVEAAEREPERAMYINATAPAKLARVCASLGVRLVHVSTDFVFDGRKREPYKVGDEPNPLSVYGQSKLQGEQEVLSALGNAACIVRTSWLHSARGANFVTKMLTRMRAEGPIRVVTDEIGSPTAAYSLAPALWECAQRSIFGVHHWSDEGIVSRYEFAEAIAARALRLGLLTRTPVLQPARVCDFKSAAQRPAYSVLDATHTQITLDMKAISWTAGLDLTLKYLAHSAGTAQ
jgi:dTDP-4-dehydrorhamnose reductase